MARLSEFNEHLINSGSVARAIWGNRFYISAVDGDFQQVFLRRGGMSNYTLTLADLFADDWELVGSATGTKTLKELTDEAKVIIAKNIKDLERILEMLGQ